MTELIVPETEDSLKPCSPASETGAHVLGCVPTLEVEGPGTQAADLTWSPWRL